MLLGLTGFDRFICTLYCCINCMRLQLAGVRVCGSGHRNRQAAAFLVFALFLLLVLVSTWMASFM